MMNILGLQDISYKEKKALVTSACQIYKRLCAVKDYIRQKSKTSKVSLSDRIVDAGRETFKSVSLFETLLGLLSADHALIIKNDFIDGRSSEVWYEEV